MNEIVGRRPGGASSGGVDQRAIRQLRCQGGGAARAAVARVALLAALRLGSTAGLAQGGRTGEDSRLVAGLLHVSVRSGTMRPFLIVGISAFSAPPRDMPSH